MKKDFRKIYCLIVLFVCSIIIFLPDNVEALDEEGDISNVCTWEITSDTLSIKSLNGDLTFLFNNNECIIDGKKLESLNVPFDDVFSDENEPLFRWMKNHPTDNLTMNVEEIQYSIGYDVFLEKISELVIRDNVNYICDDAFLGTENLKSVYILPLTIDLTNSGIGYYTDDTKLDSVKIYGYENSTAETYANENGFTFIPLGETEVTNPDQEEQITSGQLDDLVWSLDNDVLTMQHTNKDWKLTYEHGICTAEGEKIYKSESVLSGGDWHTSENLVMFQWLKNHPVYKIVLKVKRCDSVIGNTFDCGNATDIEIGEDVEFICDNAFRELSELKSVYVYSREFDLSDSGMGYFNEDIKSDILTIHGYKNSTAEKYANENGFTFIPLDEPVTEVTTSATEEVITELTTTQPVITDSVTQQSQSTVITDAASAKVNSTPKTGEKNIYGIIALGVSAAVLSVVSSKKKRNRDN